MTDADILTRMLHAVDRLDWDEVRACFAGQLRVDYTELNGGEPETLSPDDLIARWQGVLPGFDATQHLTGPVLVTEDCGGPGVRADTHVRGYHHLGETTWAVHGHYIARIRDRQITELTLQVFYQEGDLNLPAAAMERARVSPRRPRR
jgi:hypothetical protein